MDNQNDASSSFRPSQRSEPLSLSGQDVAKLVHHLIQVINVISLVAAIILALTYGTGAPFRIMRGAFTVLITIVHLISIAKFMMMKKSNIDNVGYKLLLCPDMHYLTIHLLFTYADFTPILAIVDYIIKLGLNTVNYVNNDILPLTGKTDIDFSETVKKLTSHKFVMYAPVVFEMIILVQAFLIAVFDFSLVNFATFIVYLTWIVMFDYATQAVYNQVWKKLAEVLRNHAADNKVPYGPALLIVVDSVSFFGVMSMKWYKNVI